MAHFRSATARVALFAAVPGKDMKIIAKNERQKPGNGPAMSLEATLPATAEMLRANLDAAEYKNVVPGVIRLKNLKGLGYEFRVAPSRKRGNLGSYLPQAAEEGIPRSTN